MGASLVPLFIGFPLLREATPTQRKRYEIGGGGVSLHWPEIDEDLSVEGLLRGLPAPRAKAQVAVEALPAQQPFAVDAEPASAV